MQTPGNRASNVTRNRLIDYKYMSGLIRLDKIMEAADNQNDTFDGHGLG